MVRNSNGSKGYRVWRSERSVMPNGTEIGCKEVEIDGEDYSKVVKLYNKVCVELYSDDVNKVNVLDKDK